MTEQLERRVAVVIEDDPDIRDLLRTILTQSGFDTIATANGAEGIEAVRAHQPVITTLDVSMPGMDGFAVAKRLREFSETYIIMLTGQSDEIDVIQGLESGADDYLLKPFRPRELRVRIEAMLRRPRTVADDSAPAPAAAPVVTPIHHVEPRVLPPIAEPTAPSLPPQQAQPVYAPPVPPQPVEHVQQAPQAAPVHHAPLHSAPAPAPQPVQPAASPDQLVWNGLSVDKATRMVKADGKAVELTRSEFDLLASLLESGRRVRSKADLVLTLRGETYVTTYYVTDADKRAVEVHMANLRRKIGDSSATPRWIETVRGVGYRLAED